MPTYLYYCEKCDLEFEENHSINQDLQQCPKCVEAGIESDKPKKLIAGGTQFVLNGGGWASSGYSSK